MVSKQAGQTAENRQKARRNDNQRKRETTDSNAHRFELLDRELFASVKCTTHFILTLMGPNVK